MATSFIAGPAREVNTTTAGDQAGPSVAMLVGGGHVVAWNSEGNVVAQVFDAGGAKVGSEFVLFTGHTLGGIAALADGSLVASATRSWQDATTAGPRSSLYFERFDASGHILGGPTLVDDTGNYDVWVSGGAAYALAGGGFGITDVHTTRPVPWSSVDHTVVVFDAAGNATGARIPTVSNFPQEAAQMRSGVFVTEGSTSFGPTPVASAMWRTTDAAGNTIASVAFTGQYGVNGWGEGGVVALADGRGLVVVSFDEYGSTGVGHTAWRSQWIDASGHPSGASFDLALDTQWNPHFTALADGSFVATWTQQTNYGTPWDLYAQHFDASAQPTSTATRLTSLDVNNSGYTITATPDGGFLVDTQRAGNGLDVWEQEFDLAASPDVNAWTTVSHYPGIDEVAVDGPHTAFTVSPDDFPGIERVHFSDGYAVAFDVNGNGGEAYRLYKAAFDRAPDLPGLGFQMNDLDMGYSLVHIAQNFIDSPEFLRTYGPELSNTDFITLLYRNVLDREPEAAGLQYHLDEFAHGDTRANMLTHFSESPENQANVIGQIDNGMLYIPYA